MECIDCGKLLHNPVYIRCLKCHRERNTSSLWKPEDATEELSDKNYRRRMADGFAMLNENY